MMMLTVMEDLSGCGHLVVALPSQAQVPFDQPQASFDQPQATFEVTEVTRQGTSLVLQCRPMEPGSDPEQLPHRDPTDRMFITDCDRVFITDGDVEPLSFHDPRRFYEDLR
jgi:hypothetical protein